MKPGRQPKNRSRPKRLPCRKSPQPSKFILAAGISAFLSSPQPILAVNCTWDSNPGKSGAQDGSGTWSSSFSNADWWSGTTDQPWIADNIAVFGASGTAGLVTVISPVTVGGITFNSGVTGNYTITGGTIALGAASNSFDIVANGTIAAVIVGGSANALVKSGSGTLILTASNTYTGLTTVGSGTLQLGAGANNGALAGDIDIVSNGALVYAASSTAGGATVTASGTYSSVVVSGAASANNAHLTASGYNATLNFSDVSTAGSAAITASGSNTNVNFSGASTAGTSTITASGYNANVNISGTSTAGTSTITASGYNSGVNFSGSSTASRAVITASGYNANVSFSDTSTSGSANITASGIDSSVYFSGSSTGGTASVALIDPTSCLDISALKTGSMTIGSLQGYGTLYLGGNNLVIGGNSVSTVFLGSTDDGGQSSGTGGSITKTGTGMLTLGGANSFSGLTTVISGTLILSNQYALGFSTLASGGSGIVFDASVPGGKFNFGGLSGSNDLVLVDDQWNSIVLTVGGNNSSTAYSGALSGGGSLIKTGVGTLTLAGNNTYSGQTNIDAGVLQFGTVNALYSGATSSWTASNVTVGSGATLALNVGGTNEFTNSDVTTLLGNLSAVSNDGLQAGAVIGFDTSNATGGIFTIPDNIGDSTGPGGGAVGLTKLGANTLVLSGSNTFSGPTTVTSGTLSLANQNALQMSTLASGGAGIVFDSSVTGHAFNLGGLSGTGNFVLRDNQSNAIALTVGGNNESTIYSGVLSGSGSLTKVGSGTLILNGSNSYSGVTAIEAGVLQFAAASALYGGKTTSWTAANIVVGSGATLALNVGGTNEFTNSEVTTLLGNLFTVNNNGLKAGAIIGLDTTNAAGGLFTISNNIGNSSGLGGGAIGLAKLGANTLALSGSNTYSGATNINAGVLEFNTPNALYGGNTLNWTAANIIVGAGATLALSVGGTNQFTGANVGALLPNLSAVNNDGLEAGSTIGFDTSHASGGVIIATAIGDSTGPGGGAIGVTKLGANNLALSASNSFSGETTIDAGVLDLQNSAAVVNSTVIMNGGSLVFDKSVSGHAFTLGALSANSSGAGFNILLQDNAPTPDPVALIVGNNNSSTTYAGVLSGTGSLTKTGAGTLTLTGSNVYSGITSINAGVLQFATATALYNGRTSTWTAAKINVGSGATIALNVGGTNQFTNSDVSTLLGNLSTVNNNGLKAGAAIGFDTTSASGGLFTIPDNIANSTGPGGGAIGVTKLGANILLLTGSNTYSGGTVLDAGTLTLGSSDAIGTAGTISFHGGTLQYSGSNDIDYSGRFSTAANQQYNVDTNGQNVIWVAALTSSNGVLTKSGNGTLILTGSNTYSGGTTINSGTLQLGDGGMVNGWVAGNIAVAGNNSALLYATSSTAGSAAISASGYSAALNFSGTSTAAGAIITASGYGASVNFSDAAVSGSATMTASGNGASVNFSDVSTARGASITASGYGTSVNFGGLSTADRATITAGGGGASVNFNGSSSAGSAAITASGYNATVNFNDNSTAGKAVVTASGYANVNFLGSSTAGSANITASGYGNNVNFGGASNAAAATITASGFDSGVFFSGSATGGSAIIYLSDPTSSLDISALTSGSITIGSLHGNGTVYLGSNSLAIGGNGLSVTYSGAINDGGQNGGAGGSITKTGAGSWMLTGVSNYTGTTLVDQGELIVSGSLSGTVSVKVAKGASLSILQGGLVNNAAAVALSGTLSGAGSVGPVIATGGVIAPGTPGSALVINGTVSLDTTSSFQFTLGLSKAGYDSVWSGPITLESGATLVLLDPNSVAASLVNGDILTLFGSAFGGGPTFTGMFSYMDLPVLDNGLSWSAANLYTEGEFEVLKVPEANPWAMLAGGFALMVFNSRLRRQSRCGDTDEI